MLAHMRRAMPARDPHNLAHAEPRPPRTLQQDYAQGPMMFLGGWAVSYERGTPVPSTQDPSTQPRTVGIAEQPLPPPSSERPYVEPVIYPLSLRRGQI